MNDDSSIKRRDFLKVTGIGAAGAATLAAPAIAQMLAHDGPFLIDMVVDSHVPDPSSGK